MRLPQARRRQILREIPPRRCAGRSARSGEQCREWALVGATVCVTHGALAPQVRSAAERRVSLAEEIAKEPRRSADEILLDSMHITDVLAKKEIAADSDAIVAANLQRAQLAKVTKDAGINQAAVTGEQVDFMVYAFQIVARMHGLDPSEPDVARTFAAAIRQVQSEGDAVPAGPDRAVRLKASVAAVTASMYEKRQQREAELRRQYMDELRRDSRGRRCLCCDAPPGCGQVPAIGAAEPAVRPAEASGPVVDAPVEPDGFAAVGSVQAAGGAIVEDRRPVRAVAEVGRAVGRWPACPGCGRPRDPSHEVSCGFALAESEGREWVR